MLANPSLGQIALPSCRLYTIKKDIFLSSIHDKNIYPLQQDSVSIVKKYDKIQEYSHSLIHLLVDWHIGFS